jgi:hypothetical protein
MQRSLRIGSSRRVRQGIAQTHRRPFHGAVAMFAVTFSVAGLLVGWTGETESPSSAADSERRQRMEEIVGGLGEDARIMLSPVESAGSWDELADVELTAAGRFRRTGVPDVRVVRPDHNVIPAFGGPGDHFLAYLDLGSRVRGGVGGGFFSNR